MKREFVFNATRMKERRRDLRTKQTESEELLWNQLRAHKLGYKIKRQYSLGNYVADFFCKEKKLAIEIDGGIHNKSDVKKYDEYRQQYLEALGVTIIRFTNEDISKNMQKVIQNIKLSLALFPSPESGEGR